MPATVMITPSQNVDLHEGGIGKRGGTAKVNSTVLAGTPAINGLYQFRTIAGATTIMAGTSGGKILKDADATPTELKTGLTASSFYDFITYNNKVYITVYKSTTAQVPQKWDGSATSSTDIGVPVACAAALAGAGAGSVDDGTHSYKITFTTAAGETYGGTVSNIVTVADKSTNGKVALTGVQKGPTGTTSRKIYRTVAGDTGDYKLVDTIADNTTTTYTDNIADAALGATVPSSSTAQTVPSDWGTYFPKQLVVHGYGNSERLWAFAVPGKQNWIYITPNNDGSSDADFSQATILTLYIETKDGFGLVGGMEFNNKLLVFGKQETFIIDDVDINTNNWGYVKAPWSGGAGSHRLIVPTPNDIICMQENGEIYSVVGAQQYGEARLASISRPHYIHVWIKNNIDLTKYEQFYAIYDPKKQAVRFFMMRKNVSVIDTCLSYYVDLGIWGPPESNQSYASGFSSASSALVRSAVGEYNVYTGGNAGFIWKLNQATKSDDGNGYTGAFRTPHLSFEQDEVGLARIKKRFDNGRFIGLTKGSYNINIMALVDGSDSSTTAVSLTGGGAVLGSFVLGTDTLGGNDILDKDFNIGMVGKRLGLEFSNSAVGQDFFISQIMVDFVTLGALP